MKQAFTFVRPDCSSIFGLLDTLKVVDTILFIVSAESGLDQDVDLLMTCILAQGLPSTVVAITDLDKIPLKVYNNLVNWVKIVVYFTEYPCIINYYIFNSYMQSNIELHIYLFRNKMMLNNVYKKVLKLGYLMKK